MIVIVGLLLIILFFSETMTKTVHFADDFDTNGNYNIFASSKYMYMHLLLSYLINFHYFYNNMYQAGTAAS